MKSGKIVHVEARKVKVKRALAEGASAYVFEVKDQNSGQRFALKQVIVGDEDDDMLHLCEQEIAIWRKVSGHENIVGYDSCRLKQRKNKKKPRQMLILTEFCSGGKLSEYLRSRAALPEKEVLQLLRQIASGLAHMHNQQPPVVHRDVKAENILIDANGVAKICDFGSATIGACEDLTKTHGIMRAADEIQRVTTPSHRAPEMVDIHQFHVLDEKVDIWALAVVLYVTMFKALPFGESGGMRALQGKYDIPSSPVYSKFLMKLLAMMFTVDPRERPSIRDVLRALDRHSNPQQVRPGTGRKSPPQKCRSELPDPRPAGSVRAASEPQQSIIPRHIQDASQLSSLNTIRLSPAELENWPPTDWSSVAEGGASKVSSGGGLDGWIRAEAGSSVSSCTASTAHVVSSSSSFEMDSTNVSVAGHGFDTAQHAWQPFECPTPAHRRLGSSPAQLEPYPSFSYTQPSPPNSLNSLNPFHQPPSTWRQDSTMDSASSQSSVHSLSSSSITIASAGTAGSHRSLNPFLQPEYSTAGHSRQGSCESVKYHASPPTSVELLGPVLLPTPPSSADMSGPVFPASSKQTDVVQASNPFHDPNVRREPSESA